MSTIGVRLPQSLHDRIRKLAEEERVSINQLITLTVAEKLSALDTEGYLGDRAATGSRKKFLRAVSKVTDATPPAHDRIGGGLFHWRRFVWGKLQRTPGVTQWHRC